MQALSDEQQLARLEKKVDDGFAETKTEFADVRAESRAVRVEIGNINRTILAMWVATVLAVLGVLAAHL